MSLIWVLCYIFETVAPICSVRTDGQAVGQTDMMKLIFAFPALRKAQGGNLVFTSFSVDKIQLNISSSYINTFLKI
jgi:hypothetical protein